MIGHSNESMADTGTGPAEDLVFLHPRIVVNRLTPGAEPGQVLHTTGKISNVVRVFLRPNGAIHKSPGWSGLKGRVGLGERGNADINAD
ncbi:MAG: hypothetical protein KGZ25_00060 [Planctomycetes bacterium]|nr:hypothetical protein [Planctomycetota bacterium]